MLSHLATVSPLFTSAAAVAILFAVVMLGWSAIRRIASSDYLPARDEDLDAFATNFSALVTAGPGTYGLDAAAATALAPLVATFTADLAIATNPATKTKVTVASKDAAKSALKTFIRQLAAIVQATPSVTNDAKLALGLPIHNNAPSPIPEPVTYPIIGISPTGPALLTVRFSDSATPDSKRKPSGAVGMFLTRSISATPIVDPDLLTNTDLVTRNPTPIAFNAADSGKRVYFAAKWVTRTGLEGPWSAMQSAIIP